MILKYTTKETIKSVTYVDDDYIGYKIETNKQVISVLISDSQSCCENYGSKINMNDTECYITDVDEINKIIVDKKLKEIYWQDADEGIDIIFNLEDEASFTCNIWNDHNGYYPHDYIIVIDDNEYTGNL